MDGLFTDLLFKGIPVFESRLAGNLVTKVKRWKRRHPFRRDKVKSRSVFVPGFIIDEINRRIYMHPVLMRRLRGGKLIQGNVIL